MNQNKLTFDTENLIVNWIGFNIQGLLNKKQVKQIKISISELDLIPLSPSIRWKGRNFIQ